jgi:hypothetical protein
MAESKKIQTCAPLPERERSRLAGTVNSWHVNMNASASCSHVFLSKSIAKTSRFHQ